MGDLASVINTLRGIAPWPVMRAMLRQKQIPASRGWDELLERLEGSPDRAQFLATMEDFLHEYHLHGEKWVTFLQVPEHFRVDLSSYLKTLSAQECAATNAYPLRLPDVQISGEEENDLQLVRVIEKNDDVILIFSGIFTVESKDTVYPDQYASTGLSELFASYEEIVLIRRKPSQYFPVLVFNADSGLMQALVPNLGNYGAEDVMLSNLVRSLNGFLVGRFGIDLQIHRYVNLFPAIHNIYEAASEGTVVELGFQTDTGSAKLERMKQLDLRQEPFHVKGKAAVFNSLLEFRLAVRWVVAGHDVELLLPGTTRTIAKSAPYSLYRARISGTIDRTEFQDCISKLLMYSVP